jgi:protein tyrosine/serine phosphatase
LLTAGLRYAKNFTMKRRFVSLLAVGMASAITLGTAGERGQPAQDGIRNFGKVSDTLYRGAEPGEAAFQTFKRLGIKAIIDLRMPGSALKTEAAQAHAGGILYTNIPLHGTGRPTGDQVNGLLSLLDTLPAPVFIHCQHGCDRTGTIIACYRIKHDKWSNEAALQEAEKYGLSTFERSMRKYVMAFGRSQNAKEPLRDEQTETNVTEK